MNSSSSNSCFCSKLSLHASEATTSAFDNCTSLPLNIMHDLVKYESVYQSAANEQYERSKLKKGSKTQMLTSTT